MPRCPIVAADQAGLDRAVRLLLDEQVVAIPTETVYGLAGLALHEAALLRIFAAKERPLFDPLIAHLAVPRHTVNMLDYVERRGLVDLEQVSPALRDRLDDLMSALWPGPLTIVLPRRATVPDLLTAGLPRVAVRMPAHPVAQEILDRLGVPLAAPSANRFGRISPTSAEAVAEELGERIPLIVDGGPCRLGIESTVIALDGEAQEGAGERFVLLRPGGLPRERIEERLGEKLALRTEGGQAPEAPGQLASHYAPVRPLSLVDSVNEVDYSDGTPIGVLTWRPLVADLPSHVEVRTLSIDGSTEAGARQLFAQLRALDRPPHARLYAERCPTDEGLGYAINDRLRRAAAR